MSESREQCSLWPQRLDRILMMNDVEKKMLMSAGFPVLHTHSMSQHGMREWYVDNVHMAPGVDAMMVQALLNYIC